jgi:Spy/CpxP family protein refolding chaperone
MKLLQNTKFTGPALLLLLFLNTTLLVMLVFKHPGPHPPFPPPPPPPFAQGQEGPRNFLVHELNMTDDQKTQYEKLIADHRASVGKIQEVIHGLRDSMSILLGKSSVDSSQIKMLTNKIGNEQAQLEQATFFHFQQVRSICTPDQQLKFDSVIHEALRLMGPPPPPPPPGRDRQGPPPPPPPGG